MFLHFMVKVKCIDIIHSPQFSSTSVSHQCVLGCWKVLHAALGSIGLQFAIQVNSFKNSTDTLEPSGYSIIIVIAHEGICNNLLITCSMLSGCPYFRYIKINGHNANKIRHCCMCSVMDSCGI